jgi:hypothetical protein
MLHLFRREDRFVTETVYVVGIGFCAVEVETDSFLYRNAVGRGLPVAGISETGADVLTVQAFLYKSASIQKLCRET